MLCKNCGYTIPEDCSFCPKCGKNNDPEDIVRNDGEVVVSHADINAANPAAAETISQTKKSILKSRTAKIIIAAVLIAAIAIFTWQLIGRNDLKAQLLRDWERVQTTDDGTYYRLVLDFSDNKINYDFESGISWLDNTLATFDYEVIAPNMIKTTTSDFTQIITVEFSEDQSAMTMTPSMTGADSSEIWFNID